MSWDYDFEDSDFFEKDYDPVTLEDQQVAEHLDAIDDIYRDRIRKEVTDEMNRLKAENESLYPYKIDKSKLEHEYQRKESELKSKYRKLEDELRSKITEDLLKDVGVTCWKVGYFLVETPKCDKCDKNRNITFTSPSGKELSENCECGIEKRAYHPYPYRLYKIYKDDRGFDAYFKFDQRDNDRYGHLEIQDDPFDHYTRTHEIKSGKADFEKFNRWREAFKTESEAQEYCEWLNKEQGIEV